MLRYKNTKILESQRKHIIRALNKASPFCDTITLYKSFNNDEKPIVHMFYYYQEDSTNYQNELGRYSATFKNNTIYSKESVNIEKTFLEEVINAVIGLSDNINHQKIAQLINYIKEVRTLKVPNKEEDELFTNFFDLKSKETIIDFLSDNIFGTVFYSNKVYNQIYNRLAFKNSGVYSTLTDGDKQLQTIKPQYITEFDSLQIKLKFIYMNKWFFSDGVLSEIRKKIEIEKKEKEDLTQYTIDTKELQDIQNMIDIGMILKTNDKNYLDALDVLKWYAYDMYEEIGYGNPIIINKNYKNSKIKIWDEEDALNYIKEFNSKNKGELEVLYRVFDANESPEDYNYRYENDIVDYDAFNDTTNKTEVRDSALSFDIQLEDTYITLFNEFKQSKENNRFKICFDYANEIVNEYNGLIDNNNDFFYQDAKKLKNKLAKNGNVNFSNKLYKSIDNELFNKLKKEHINNDIKNVLHIKNILMKYKRQRWKLLYQYLNRDNFIQSLLDFNHNTLEFEPNQNICPF